MKQLLMLSMAIFALVGCSKSNPQIQLKEKIVEQNVHTYDALTANEEFVTSDTKGLIQVINKIRRSRSVNFNWKSFWFNVSDKVKPHSLSEETSSELFSLAKMSCGENPESVDLVLAYAKKGLEDFISVSSDQSIVWLKHFLNIGDICGISNENRFIVEYSSVFKVISREKEFKGLKILILEDLNIRLPKPNNQLLVNKLKTELYSNGDGIFLVDLDSLSFEEIVLFSKVHDLIFPYRENPFLVKLLSNPKTDIDSVEAALPTNFSKALRVIESLQISDNKLPILTDKILQRWGSLQIQDNLTAEEKITSFGQSLNDAEIIFSLLEKELKQTANLTLILGKLEILYRKLESSFILIPRKEQTLLKYDRHPLVLLLDLRLSKSAGSQTLFESGSVKVIKTLSNVVTLFHSFQGKGAKDASLDSIKTYCEAVKQIELNSITDKTEFINGCQTLRVSKPNSDLTIKKNRLTSPLFSVLNLSGVNLTISSDIIDLGIINTSQVSRPDSLKIDESHKIEPIIFPLVLGFEVNEAFLDFKKGRTYYFPLNYVQQGAQNGLPHKESDSVEGLPAGNLILKVSNFDKSYLPTFVAEGGESAGPLKGLKGSKSISFDIDLYSIEEWLASSEGENTVLESYPLDLMSAKNLKNLFSKMKRNSGNKIVIKVDPNFLNNIGSSAKKVFDESAQSVGGIKSLDDLASTALASLQAEIEERIANGAELSKVPMLYPSFKLSAGSDGPEQMIGKNGRKGKIIYE